MNTDVLSQKVPGTRPNIIIIIADDIGADDIGCYGNKEVKTPNIDKLAKEGLRFTNAFVATSSCTPSRAAIMSGRYPHNTGAAELHTSMTDEVAIFPELLKEAGYYTAAAGKWHLGEAVQRGFHQLHLNQKENGDGGEEMWIQTLQERPRDKPFFLWLAADDGHRPWGLNPYSGTHDPSRVVPPPYNASSALTRKDLAQFYDEVFRFDHYIGLVEAELKKQGVLDNTLILIMGDNGRPFPRAKTRIYDSGVRTPFVVKWNKGLSQKGAVSTSLVSAIDIAPTVLELAGVKATPGVQGKSFTHVLKNPALPFRNYVFTEHNWHDYEAHERGLRTADFLYIVNRRPHLDAADHGLRPSPSTQDLRRLRDSGRLNAAQADVFVTPRPYEELYDVKNDPMQLVNLASVPKYATQLKQLRGVMQRWQEETGDTVPANLTGDWYDRESGKALDTRGKRGTMPGGSQAVGIIAPGPF
ncbi:MAG TPA: sulfatase [Chitinophagaceae bacterium]